MTASVADAFAATASVAGAFAATARRVPDRAFLNVLDETATHYAITAGPILYRDVLAAARTLAEAYAAAGIGVGDRVAVLLENRPGLFEHFLALNQVGASLIPINPDWRQAELSHVAQHGAPRLAVATPHRCADLQRATAAVGGCEVVAMGDPFPAIGPPQAATAPADPNREAALLYTSGTTGGPKGCILSNTYFLEAGRWYREAGGLCALEDGDTMLTPLPLFHMNALAYSVMAMIAVGGCLTVLDRFHPSTWWHSVRSSGATVVHYLGVMPAMLMKAAQTPGDRDHAVRFGFGANVEPPLHAPFEARFGFPLIEAWAMTETGAGACIVANRTPRQVGRKAFGRPGPEVEVMLAGDDGADAGDGPGELLVRRSGPDPRYGFFSGYHKDDAATAAAWRDGWFHTGDVVRWDKGDLIFVDRKKNIIRRSGENIAAVEVEAMLLTHEGVRAAAVSPVPDPIRNEEVFALVVPAADDHAGQDLAEDLVRYALSQLAYYKAPGYIAFQDALPVTTTQKVQRGVLKHLAAETVQSGKAFDLRAHKTRRA
ncbi:MAG: AMP-binding protein [Pseudomonadota bacterium]